MMKVEPDERYHTLGIQWEYGGSRSAVAPPTQLFFDEITGFEASSTARFS